MLTLKAHAKINLTLEVLGRRDDGYHEVATIMQTVDLHDTIRLTPAVDITLTCDDPTLQSPDNLAFKAATAPSRRMWLFGRRSHRHRQGDPRIGRTRRRQQRRSRNPSRTERPVASRHVRNGTGSAGSAARLRRALPAARRYGNWARQGRTNSPSPSSRHTVDGRRHSRLAALWKLAE